MKNWRVKKKEKVEGIEGKETEGGNIVERRREKENEAEKKN